MSPAANKSEPLAKVAFLLSEVYSIDLFLIKR